MSHDTRINTYSGSVRCGDPECLVFDCTDLFMIPCVERCYGASFFANLTLI
jgi:hypothetical protein